MLGRLQTTPPDPHFNKRSSTSVRPLLRILFEEGVLCLKGFVRHRLWVVAEPCVSQAQAERENFDPT